MISATLIPAEEVESVLHSGGKEGRHEASEGCSEDAADSVVAVVVHGLQAVFAAQVAVGEARRRNWD